MEKCLIIRNNGIIIAVQFTNLCISSVKILIIKYLTSFIHIIPNFPKFNYKVDNLF